MKKPGGAVRDAIDIASSSHLIVMPTDLETDPHIVSKLIETEKKILLILQRLPDGCKKANLLDMTYAFQIFPKKLVKRIHGEELKHPFYMETALKPIADYIS